MIQEIGKNISKDNFIKLIINSLESDKDNQAYERSLYYVLNATRRGGFIFKDKDDIFVFAKSYDKPNSLSLIYFSNPDSVNSEIFEKFLKEFPNKELFAHHLFERRAEEIIYHFKNARMIDLESSNQINSYPDEDNYPQVIFPINSLPKFNNSSFLKIKNIFDLLGKNGKSGFQSDILEYLNATQRILNEPEFFTVLIEEDTKKEVYSIVKQISKSVAENWAKKQKDNSKEFEEYYLSPIIKLLNMLIDSKVTKLSKSKIIFRAAFDIKLNKGGFWIGEYIPHKSLLIPHVILTDYHYKEQYKFLLYDIIRYGYLKGFEYVNLGGSEDKNLFDIKSLPKIFFSDKQIERKLHTIYIPKQD